MSRIAFVVAASRNSVIGRGGKLPWHVVADLKLFKATTMGKPVIMGRKTWESLPRKPLPGRPNIVMTTTPGFAAQGAMAAASVAQALELADAHQPEEICVIGGGEIYRLFWDKVDRVYLTEIDLVTEGDTFLPVLDPAAWTETHSQQYEKTESNSAGFVFRVLDRNRSIVPQ